MTNLTGMSPLGAEVSELHADRELALGYLKCAMESLDDLHERSAGLLVLRSVVETIATLDCGNAGRHQPQNFG